MSPPRLPKAIITVAPTGSIPTRKDTPYLPITPEEIAEETYRSYKAGAAVVHLHARDPMTGAPTGDVEVFRRYVYAIRDKCPDIIIQLTTGGGATTLGLTPEQRLAPVVALAPLIDSASLNAGSMNFGRALFCNTPDIIEQFARTMAELGVKPEFECYDTGMPAIIEHFVRKPGILPPPHHFSIIVGVLGGAQATPRDVLNLADALPSDCTWQVIGIGRHQFSVAAMGLWLGGGVRVGFEDNIYIKKGVLAKSNAELVEKAVDLALTLGREVATVAEARQILSMPLKH